jgi:hypothetical protein
MRARATPMFAVAAVSAPPGRTLDRGDTVATRSSLPGRDHYMKALFCSSDSLENSFETRLTGFSGIAL